MFLIGQLNVITPEVKGGKFKAVSEAEKKNDLFFCHVKVYQISFMGLKKQLWEHSTTIYNFSDGTITERVLDLDTNNFSEEVFQCYLRN